MKEASAQARCLYRRTRAKSQQPGFTFQTTVLIWLGAVEANPPVPPKSARFLSLAVFESLWLWSGAWMIWVDPSKGQVFCFTKLWELLSIFAIKMICCSDKFRVVRGQEKATLRFETAVRVQALQSFKPVVKSQLHHYPRKTSSRYEWKEQQSPNR